MNDQRCDQCENACPVGALKCGRGRRRFGLEAETKHKHGMPDDPIGLLRQCGHILHHGGLDSETALSALSQEEQTELSRMLKILLQDWKGYMSEKPNHQHGHHT